MANYFEDAEQNCRFFFFIKSSSKSAKGLLGSISG